MYRPLVLSFYQGTKNSRTIVVTYNDLSCPVDLTNVTRLTIQLTCVGGSTGAPVIFDSDEAIMTDRMSWNAKGEIKIDPPDDPGIDYGRTYGVTIKAYDAISSEPTMLVHHTDSALRFRFER